MLFSVSFGKQNSDCAKTTDFNGANSLTTFVFLIKFPPDFNIQLSIITSIYENVENRITQIFY
ncbi:hypothetical protein TK11N_04920 [Tetragenococcus koreensis]|uniref:Uncharacterized protein n=1 Tax=Tetragenococcus koreensis TaxID=290335 RepID=A0AAN4RJF1_9ENTE|nr:hypothetical protein TKO01_05830 [Tetragenococcus koreensis]GEQ48640.1 hypothetical protein TK11N_04920 [Tetragenococcus koreensis]GEQ51069.1 hypothetical protein TK12N_04130 [Tetragenococcus koreensis]GEQ53648.1 hypothetical protein TK2N_04920 [Tetragenococcus koreensis]GEQ56017.1 hypothetical protein TK4N_03600 [Tetragenococcus koreensis]